MSGIYGGNLVASTVEYAADCRTFGNAARDERYS